jgi:hypothetical protein
MYTKFYPSEYRNKRVYLGDLDVDGIVKVIKNSSDLDWIHLAWERGQCRTLMHRSELSGSAKYGQLCT